MRIMAADRVKYLHELIERNEYGVVFKNGHNHTNSVKIMQECEKSNYKLTNQKEILISNGAAKQRYTSNIHRAEPTAAMPKPTIHRCYGGINPVLE